jgi:DMSO/TMAO reductase YedYZ heme-binding membrane subunit
MYRRVPSQEAPSLQDSPPPSSPRGVLASFALVIVLSLLGAAAVAMIGYYLPQSAAKSYWFVSRSSGVIAYVLVTFGVLWGLIQSGSLLRERVAPLLALGMHSFLNWLALGFAALHGIILIGDHFIKIGLPEVFTPFLSPYRPVPVGLGIIAFYLMLLLALSFYARNHLGQKNFRLLHYVSYAVFLMVTVHGVLAGTDIGALWWLYAVSLIVVAVMTVMRITGSRREQMRRQAPRPAPARATVPVARRHG